MPTKIKPEPISYSRRLGKITPEQFQAALERFGLGQLVRTQVVPYGLFGQNVFLTSTAGEFVLRGAPHYDWQFPTERFFTDLLHEKTRTPVAHPYLIDPTNDIFGWSYAIMPRLPGMSLLDSSFKAGLSKDDRQKMAWADARALLEAQRLTWEYAGKYDHQSDMVHPLSCSYREWVVEHSREKVNDIRACSERITDADLEWIEAVIAAAAPYQDSPYQARIVLGDYGEHNLLVLRDPGGWRVSGMFDLMTAHFGDGDADLCLPVVMYLKEDERLADAFVGEYLACQPAANGFARRQALYTIDLRLSFWRYFAQHPEGAPEDIAQARSFRSWAERSVTYWDKHTVESI
jgi:aminoglycoside phosphotransferase (APT) family kinase protein